jgi:CubicO group peptidase (beta-lactamase class C family)
VVNLDDEAGPPGSTLLHLLSHASGLSPDSDRVMANQGTRRIYSNHGIEVAAAHLEAAGDPRFHDHLEERVLGLLDMTGTKLDGSPAHGMEGPIEDLATLAHELLRPRLLMPEVVALASTVAFPGLSGVLPGFGKHQHNDWGLGCEIRDHKSPHWTAPENSPETFGHFGQSGSFMWVDRSAGMACVSLCDTAFGPWAAQVWPRLSGRLLEQYA